MTHVDERVPTALWDADNHYYEPRDCFTRYLDPKFADRAIEARTDADGRQSIVVDGRPFTFLLDAFRDTTTKPGSLREMLKAMASGSFSESDVREPIQPEYVDAHARLAAMDRQGVEAILLFPTLAVCVEHFLKHDADLLYATFHAFNRWLADDWGFDRAGRIFAVPMLSLLDVEHAVDELEFVLGAGARAIALRPGPAYGRSPADPALDPFWGRVNEARVPVCFHIGESGYNELYSVTWGEEPNPSSHRQSAFQWTSFYGDRPIMDTFSALVLHNLFGRFPDVQCISVENGSLWVPYLLKVMNKMNGMGRNGPWLGGRISTRPSEIFRAHVSVAPYHEEDIVALAGVIGDDRILFGSDYPHAEGLAEPCDFADLVAPLGEPAVTRIMGANLRKLLGAPA
jgi:predicted TIM-barrel fold metal-dependent hydrolase